MNFRRQLRKRKFAQSAIEYVLVVAIAMAALIFFLGPTGRFKNAVNYSVQMSVNQMVNMINSVTIVP